MEESMEELEAELMDRKEDFVAMAAVFDYHNCTIYSPVSSYRSLIAEVTDREAIQKLAPILQDIEELQQEYFDRLIKSAGGAS